MPGLTRPEGGAGTVSLFGKLPWAVDYVRIHHRHPAAIALDAWLQQCTQALALARCNWPTQSVRFVFNVPAQAAVLLGTWTPSRDRAGRKFPVCLSCPIPHASLRGRSASLVRTSATYMAALDQALVSAPERDQHGTIELVESLHGPRLDGMNGLVRSDAELRAVFANTTFAEFAHAALDGEDAVTRALDALARAESSVKSSVARTKGVVIDAPVRQVDQLEIWLSLLTACVPESELPSVFWTVGDAPRALIAFGPVAPALSTWLTRPELKSERLLTLTKPDARAPVRALGEELARLSIDQLLKRLAGMLPGEPARK